MRAAERLIAKHGIENISIRSIVAEAGQKNESALQYHFSNLTGLIEAIQAERFELIKRQRESMTEALLRYSPTPTLQQLCDLMVMPVVHLARQDEEFLFFIRAFSSLPLMTEASPWSLINSLANGAPTDHAMVTMLRERLPHLDRQAFHHRMDAAVRLCASSMFYLAKQDHGLNGQDADLFLSRLVDALVGLLSAALSARTQALIDATHPLAE